MFTVVMLKQKTTQMYINIYTQKWKEKKVQLKTTKKPHFKH